MCDPMSAAERLVQEVLQAYPLGLFPMARAVDDPSYDWFSPEVRGVLPIADFHASRSLRRSFRQNRAQLRFGFVDNIVPIIDHCAARPETWINDTIRQAFVQLSHMGVAHGFAVYHGDQLMGGVYGLALGGAFMGESMFSTQMNGSKFALWGLCHLLDNAGYRLFDTQYPTSHLTSLGGVAIDAAEYQTRLDAALRIQPQDLPKGIHALDLIE